MKLTTPFCLLSIMLAGSVHGAENTCHKGVSGMSTKEIADILPRLEIDDGRTDLVGFNCRDPNNSRHIILATQFGSNLGDLYVVTIANGVLKAKVAERGQFRHLEILKDNGGAAFLLVSGHYLHQGPMFEWHELVNFKTGETEKLAEAFEDAIDGWCGPGEGYTETTASEMDSHIESRSDGLKNIVYKIQSMNCETKNTTAKALRYIPGKNGFHLG
ncbi:MAG: hypothetical protein KGJ78_02670 [Alphaproteobacteria bacterium]|nr:hypothetical protein [Alphaproteobacteria bacterium]